MSGASDSARRRAFADVWHDPAGPVGALRTIQNIPLSRRYMTAAFAFFLAGGALALVMRLQLALPGADILGPRTYNQFFTMHGTTMMFLFVIPFLEALAAYMLPLMLGTRELPFPRMTALSFWTYIFGGLFLYSSFLFGLAPDGGWFAYPPLTGPHYSPGLGIDFWDIGLSVAEIAAMGAAAELIVGVLRMRAPGMSLARLPVYAWAMLATGAMIIFAFTPLIVGTAMLELDRKHLTRFFDPVGGGKPLLWQHIFWVFGHPEVYIMFVPAVGIVSHVVQVFTRRPLAAHALVICAIVATAFISFGLWVHHMFATGMAPLSLVFFTAATMLIAVPNGIQVVAWIATVGAGTPRWHPALLFVVGFLVIFVLGGLTGVMLAAVPFNWQAHDSHFVVAHLHYVLIGGVLFPMFAGLYYWFPKLTGRLLSERLGRWHFWLMFAFFNVAFFPMHITGLLGMPRRVWTYGPDLGWTAGNLISTAGAWGLGGAILLFLVNAAWSLKRGPRAGPDPWGGDTLEWSETSPPSEAQFPQIPVVTSRHPRWSGGAPPPDAATAAAVARLDHAPTRWRGALLVSAVDGRPLAIAQLPGPTIVPLVVSLGVTGLLIAALVDSVGIAALGGFVTLVGLVSWFWPRAAERAALDEMAAPGPGGLPLAIGGTMANGWWATVVLVAVLATALTTLVASYVYLGDGALAWAPAVPDMGPAIAASALLVADAPLIALAVGSLRSGAVWRRRLSLAAATVLGILSIAVSVGGYRALGAPPHESAYGSIVLAVLGYQWLVAALSLAMLFVAQLWTWLSPGDRRGHAVVLNSALVRAYAVLNGLIAFATVYLAPRLG